MRRRWVAAAMALLLSLSAACLADTAKNIEDRCKYWVSEGSAANVRDESIGSAWKPTGENPELRIMLPDGGAAFIQINWTVPPTNYTMTEYDANQNVVATHTAAEDDFACISQLLPLNASTKYVFLNFSQLGQGVNKIRVYSQGDLPNTVVKWEAPHEKCDLMVVSTHEDDEWLWFGGIIPYYDLVMDKKVQVVYMANCGRLRYAEALNSLAVSGVRTYPLFVGLKDKRDSSLDASIQTWGGKDYILKVMVSVIRRFKPEVILTHDWDGEYGHPQHILTSRCMEYAIEAAADPSQYPESAEEYGAWQVKKLYRHLEEKGRIQFDWHVAYPEFGGRTGIQVATDSMNQHASQLKYYQVEDHGKYDNSIFGLSYSVVGDDQLHEDLFENIPESAEAASEAAEEPAEEPATEAEIEEAEPEATAEAVTEAMEVPAAEAAEASAQETERPTRQPVPTPEPKPVREKGGSAMPLIIAGAAVIAGGGIAYLLYTREQARRRRYRRRKGQRRAAPKARKPAPKKGDS